MTAELIRQVRLLDPVTQSDRVADVLLVDGVIQSVEAEIRDYPQDTQIRDGAGLILGTGLVDLYSHSGEPGHEERETIDSLAAAAIAGGFTRLTLLPDTRPAVDNPATVAWFQSQCQKFAVPKIQTWGALTLGVKGEQMTELAELAESGIAGFTDGQPIQNMTLLRRLLEYGEGLAHPIALWCCDRSLTGNGVVREGAESLRLGLPGSPDYSETAPLAALLECVATIGTPVHIMRVSTARGVELIRHAKAAGLPVTASTTWMHLILNIEAVHSYDPSLHIEPPLGNPIDQAALLEGIRSGVLDAIAIDHSPYTYEEKTVAFAESPPGAIGLELALPLLWQELVATEKLAALTLWQALSTNPARLLNQTPSTLQAGQPAECVLFDPNESWEVNSRSLKSRSTNTSWLNQTLQGRVLQVWGGKL
ncbi:dihydroorotase [Leptolyngbya ohadii]|uniref:dihydroorotase n=1 Tax=Leptolyngbya ohadii TaxID=1962290 RepID=UPI000B59B865|nr:dihydroorotase [Leptolyngbya ohadii]